MPPIAKRLRAKLGQVLRQQQLLPKGAGVLVAVSGGQDSVCLLQLLCWWQPTWQWQLVVGHCDHRWRADSGENVQSVAQLAQKWGLSFALRTAEPIPQSESAAREWRYHALGEMAEEHHCQFVVTGHTLSDRAETFLYNLLRGSGGRGAMTWKRLILPLSSIYLVRPLLGITRQETGEFCQALNLPVYSDSTNSDVRYRRNRIRLELMPYLQKHFNPQVETALAQTAILWQLDNEYLDSLAQEFWHSHDITHTRLARSALRKYPIPIQYRIIRQYLQYHTGQVEYDHILKLANLLSKANHSQTDPLPNGLIAIVIGDYIHLQPLALP